MTTEQPDQLPQMVEQFKSDWQKISSSGNEEKWTCGDLAIEYIEAAKNTGVEPTENKLLKLLAGSVEGETYSSLRSYAWVCRAFPLGSIRDMDVSWSLYKKAAGSKKPNDWITIAADERLTVLDLAARIAKDEEKVKHYRGPEIKCTMCQRTTFKSEYNLHKGDELIGIFCSYGCLAAYASKAAINNKIREDYE